MMHEYGCMPHGRGAVRLPPAGRIGRKDLTYSRAFSIIDRQYRPYGGSDGGVSMLGWIVKTENTEPLAAKGELLGCDGRTYAFAALPVGTDPALLTAERAVTFEPTGETETFPAAGEIRLAEDADTPEMTVLKEKLRARLSEKRYLHCFRVSKIARAFAVMAGYSPERAELSGLLHDVAKEQPGEENVRIILENGLPVTSFELKYHHIIHAMAGAVVAEKEFGVTDPEVLNGIRYHNGRPAMETVDKITFLADHADQMYRQGISGNILLDAADLDDAVYRLILVLERYFVSHRMQPDVITECTMNYMLQRTGAANEAETESRSEITDDLFDEALRVNARQSLPLRSVSNIRDLGGYKTDSGKTVRKNRLIRSGNLSSMTPEDAEALRALGIDTVIDLRTAEETAEAPDANIGGFRYVSCPLPTVEIDQYHRSIAEKHAVTRDSREKTFYLAEFLNCISMEDMYWNVLTGGDSAASLRKMLSALLDADCRGALIHCVSGKDRTGIVSFILLLILGAALSDIRADYYASSVSTFAAAEKMAQSLRLRHYSAQEIDEARYFSGIGMAMAENAYARLREEYGSTDNYLAEALCLTEEKRRALRDKFLE